SNFKYVSTIKSPVGSKYYGTDSEIYFASLLYREPIVTVTGMFEVTAFNVFYWKYYDIYDTNFVDYVKQDTSAIDINAVLNFLSDSTSPNPIVINPNAGIIDFIVTVRDIRGCPKPVKDIVRLNVNRIIADAGPRDTAIAQNQPLYLHATGSTNSLDHFIQYFSKCPHLFRGSRTSLAVITGNESDEELVELGKDLFHYYGRGCRNVSHLLLPENYSLNRIFEAIVSYGEVVNNKKYGNNYDYYKSIHLMNLEKFLDNNFVLVKESQELFSPLAMIYYSFYSNENEAKDFISKHEGNIQCIVGSNFIPFGKAQAPALTDYADNIDTMAWLENL
ncbi:MAG: hypothetical protein EBU61_06625, partial [Crocinitomicaceae bacterium]|nr:hypothetical protein [Crocinitomicaceae bacterium]